MHFIDFILASAPALSSDVDPNLIFNGDDSQPNVNYNTNSKNNMNQSSTGEPEEGQDMLLSNHKGLSTEQVIALSSRLSYNTGHGDFCFGRLVDRPKKSWTGLFYPQEYLGRGSNGIPVVTLDTFERSGYVGSVFNNMH